MVKEGEGRVKEVWAKNVVIREKNNSLSLPSLLHLYPLSTLFFPLFLCMCERGGEGREVSSRRSHATVAVGTSGTAMPPAARSDAPSTTDPTKLTEPHGPRPNRSWRFRSGVLSVLSASEVVSVVSGAERVEVLSVLSEASATTLAAGRSVLSQPATVLATPARGFRQFCRFCQRCMVRSRSGSVSSVGSVIDVMCGGTGVLSVLSDESTVPP